MENILTELQSQLFIDNFDIIPISNENYLLPDVSQSQLFTKHSDIIPVPSENYLPLSIDASALYTQADVGASYFLIRYFF
jgi:hypothetical protein